MINKLTGEITIGETMVGPNFTKAEFENSFLFSEVIGTGLASPNNFFKLKPQRIGENIFSLIIRFKKTGLVDIITLSITEDGKPRSWQDWSYENEMQRKQQHEKILEKNLGSPPYEYQWGSVASVYIEVESTSKIVIHYS